MAENPPYSDPRPPDGQDPTCSEANSLRPDSDSGLDGASGFGDSMSLASSILKYREENGRTYHAYKAGSYFLPNDDPENERLDMQHHMCLLTLRDRLFISPVGQDRPLKRVLDAGCGTGIWALDFADEFPDTEVVGVDLSPIQPSLVLPNTYFFVDDLEAEWTYAAPFDLIYLRAMTGSIRDWPSLFRQALDNLTPHGYIELLDPIYPLTCEDGTVPEDSAVYEWSKLMNEAATKLGSSLDSGLRYREQLIEAGFVNVVEKTYRWPMNPWPKDPELKELGRWGNVNLTGGVQGLSLMLFTRVLGWETDNLEVFLAKVRADLSNPRMHGYWKVKVVYGQKPA